MDKKIEVDTEMRIAIEEVYKRVYIAGKITGEPNYREKFKAAAENLESLGLKVMNPAVFPEGFTHRQYMEICYKMIDACEIVVLLPDWLDSKGAIMEYEYAAGKRMPTIPYEAVKAPDPEPTEIPTWTAEQILRNEG